MKSALLPVVAALGFATAAAADGPPGVLVAEVVRTSFPMAIEAPGTARANESVEIRPQITERIRAIRFEEGQHVEPGRVLVELHDSEVLADVAAARATLAESESQARRARELSKSKALAASEVETRLARRDADRAALAAAEARLAETKVRAPFAGRVGLRRVSPGSLVGPDTLITTLDDTETIKLDFDVPETAVSMLAEDLPIRARSAAWPDELFEGRVVSVDTRVDPVSRSVTVRALLPNPEQRLRPGMFLAVTLVRDDVTALVIPEQALVPERSRQYVFVVGEHELVEKREVRTGRRRPGEVEVLNGLAEGERVVAEGTQKVRSGEPVVVQGEIELGAAVGESSR